MRLHELVEEIDLPPTQVADGAWDVAVHRMRRRRAIAVVGAASLVVAATAIGVVVPHRNDAAPPTQGPASSSPPSGGPRIATPQMASPAAYDPETYRPLVDEPVRPPADAPKLSSDPIAYAKLAITPEPGSTDVFLLGPDDRWRRLDQSLQSLDDGTGNLSSPFRSTSLSPDATMLALPQPSGLLIVDLRDGSGRTYPVPQPYLTYAVWLSDSSVVVATESPNTGWEVDIEDGDVSRSRYGPSTGRAPDGGLVTWGMGDDGLRTDLEWSNGVSVSSEYNNTAGLHPYPPLADHDVVVGHSATTHSGLGLPVGQIAMMVVDRDTGNPLAYLPTIRSNGDATTLLGWHEGQVVVALVGENNSSNAEHTVVLASWNWEQKTLAPLGTIAAWQVAWGRNE